MSKTDEKDKDKRDKKGHESGKGPAVAVATCSDGHPQDVVQYLESKLILKPDRFVSVESFREFGRIMQRTAKRLGVGFVSDPKAGRRPDIREIIFFDTPDFRLYNNAFILRRRTSYVDGFPVGDPEMVFKFRHPDQQKAACMDVRPNIAGAYRIKFKAEALPLKEEIGGYRLLYSHNCVFGLSQMHDADKNSMGTLARVFPVLAGLKKSDDEKVGLVNEGIVEEVLLELGELDFGKGDHGPMQCGAVADARRTHATGGRVCLPEQVLKDRGRGGEIKKAARAVFHLVAAGCARLAGAGSDQDGDGVSPERKYASKP